MIIKHFKVTNLNQNKTSNFDLNFNEDINILTGKNGTGKTTILKLIWYLISGNIDRMMTEEAIFDSIAIETNTFSLNIKIDKIISITWNIGKGEQHSIVEPYKENGFYQFLNKEILKVSDSSIFFPTFRRMEGGFFTSGGVAAKQRGHIYQALEEGVDNLSKDLSVRQHQFITSISTDDIVNFMTRQYAEVSEKNNELQKQLAKFIKERTTQTSLKTEREALNEIQLKTDEITEQTDKLLKPFTTLSKWVTEIFQYQGIKLTDNLILGKASNALSSDKLSSGEKQMLSFLCYNAFYNQGIIFIDEPELSLHVDWQRTLFDILLEQGTTNQFIIATHSPFIYSQFPDKELILDFSHLKTAL
jgi:predicted ATPase